MHVPTPREDGSSEAACSDGARATLADMHRRLIGPAVMGWQCGHDDRFSSVLVSLYRDVECDEIGATCARGAISYHGELHWYVEPPTDVLMP